MKSLCVLVIVLALGSNPSGQELELDRNWKLKAGDDNGWSAPELDEADWRAVKIAQPWEVVLGEAYDGYGWYRNTFRVPRELQRLSDTGFVLELGQIDDVDEVWFNGTKIGSTGQFPPAYETAWTAERRYFVPLELLTGRAEHVIAVRVFDGMGGGGLYRGTPRLVPAEAGDQVQVGFVGAFAQPRVLERGDAHRPKVLLRNRSKKSLTFFLSWKLETDAGEHVSEGSEPVALAPGETLGRSLPIEFAEPGFYELAAFGEFGERSQTEPASTRIGFATDEISSPLTRPDDFDEFWSSTLAELASVEPDFQVVAHPDRDIATHHTFEVTMRSLDQVRVKGWIQVPKDKRDAPFPAVLIVPGYTQSMEPLPEITGNSILFCFNIRGHGRSTDDVKFGRADFWLRGLEDPDGYFYQGAYSDCVRAVDYLVSREDVDESRLAVTGASQGGGLSLATAALDPRIDLCAPDIPWLCSWERYFATAVDANEIDAWVQRRSTERSQERVMHVLSYFDNLNLVERIRCPVLVGMGLADDICPPATIYATYNRIQSEKGLVAYPQAAHWVPFEHYGKKFGWFVMKFGEISRR